MNRKTAYFGISALFGAEILLTATHADRLVAAPAIFWILTGFAAFHLARVISFSAVGAWLRGPFTQVIEDTSGAGESVEPKAGNVLGELLACPVCTGTHVAALVVLAYAFVPGLGLAAAAIAGLAGIGHLIHWGAEYLEWGGRSYREASGSARLLKTRGEVRGAYCDDPRPIPPQEIVIRTERAGRKTSVAHVIQP